MTETIVINNPSPELLKFLEDRQREKKERMDEIKKKYEQERGTRSSQESH